MRVSWRRGLGVCIFLLSVFFLSSAVQAAEWGIKLQLEDSVYSVGGELAVDVSYYNLTDRPVVGTCRVTGGLGCCYDLVIEDQEGQVVTKPRALCLMAFSRLQLAPHTVHNLHHRVPLIQGEYGAEISGAPLAPGLYRLCFRDRYQWLDPKAKGGNFTVCVPFYIKD